MRNSKFAAVSHDGRAVSHGVILQPTNYCTSSAGSILDISKYRDTCERSISILGGIAILRYIEYRMNQ